MTTHNADNEQAIAFKKYLAGQKAQRSGEGLCKATLDAPHVERFFHWRAGQPSDTIRPLPC